VKSGGNLFWIPLATAPHSQPASFLFPLARPASHFDAASAVPAAPYR